MTDSHPMPRPVLSAQEARERIAAVEQFMVAYRSAIDEIETKLRVLQREFTHTDSYSPIESVSTRLKSMESLVRKARKRDCRHLDDVRARVTDIAGIRVICSFTHDVYRVRDLLLAQDDVTLLEQKDYVAHPKPNGYRSLHLIVEVPIFLSTGPQPVPVEVQLRTIAMLGEPRAQDLLQVRRRRARAPARGADDGGAHGQPPRRRHGEAAPRDQCAAHGELR